MSKVPALPDISKWTTSEVLFAPTLFDTVAHHVVEQVVFAMASGWSSEEGLGGLHKPDMDVFNEILKEFGTTNRSEAEHYAEAVRLFRIISNQYLELIDGIFVGGGFLPVDPDQTTIPSELPEGWE